MQPVDHIIHAKWIITGIENQNTLTHHSLIIDKGFIKEINPTQTAKEKYSAKKTPIMR